MQLFHRVVLLIKIFPEMTQSLSFLFLLLASSLIHLLESASDHGLMMSQRFLQFAYWQFACLVWVFFLNR